LGNQQALNVYQLEAVPREENPQPADSPFGLKRALWPEGHGRKDQVLALWQ
jgi:hypothetical protein